MRIHFKVVLGILLPIAASLYGASEVTPFIFESGEEKVSLLELYTSEGCSSCPPAESWLNELKNNPDLWKKFVPVSFHVDYWNSLGWPDPYSSAKYTARQRSYGDAWHSNSIYTPEFVLNGREWRPAESSFTPSGKIVGSLRGRITADRKVEIVFVPRIKTTGAMMAETALLGLGIQTVVRRGENAGRTLQHDFLSLALLKCQLEPSATGECKGSVTLPVQTGAPAAAIAIWVHSADDLAPIQAVGGWLKQE
jgi:hypothetical protein